MGIPSYFVHIVKNHGNIIKKFVKTDINIDNLYLDSNSIIYDAINNLEYKINDSETKIYDYDVNKIIMWDSCKFVHRTQPYKLNYPKKRVLVSVNLSTNEKWAVNTVNKCLKYQGNNLNV